MKLIGMLMLLGMLLVACGGGEEPVLGPIQKAYPPLEIDVKLDQRNLVTKELFVKFAEIREIKSFCYDTANVATKNLFIETERKANGINYTLHKDSRKLGTLIHTDEGKWNEGLWKEIDKDLVRQIDTFVREYQKKLDDLTKKVDEIKDYCLS